MKFSVYCFVPKSDYINGTSDEIYKALSNKFPEENLKQGDVKFAVKDVLYDEENEIILIKVYENYNSDRNSGIKENDKIVDHDDFIRDKNGVPLLIRFILIDKRNFQVYKNSDCKQKTVYSLLDYLMRVNEKSIKPVVDIEELKYFNRIKVEERSSENINIFNYSDSFRSIEEMGVVAQDIDKLEFTLSTNKLIATNRNVIDKIMKRAKLISISGQNKDGKVRWFDSKFQKSIEIDLKYDRAPGLDEKNLKEIMELLLNEI